MLVNKELTMFRIHLTFCNYESCQKVWCLVNRSGWWIGRVVGINILRPASILPLWIFWLAIGWLSNFGIVWRSPRWASGGWRSAGVVLPLKNCNIFKISTILSIISKKNAYFWKIITILRLQIETSSSQTINLEFS